MDITSVRQATIMVARWQRRSFWNTCVSIKFCWSVDFFNSGVCPKGVFIVACYTIPLQSLWVNWKHLTHEMLSVSLSPTIFVLTSINFQFQTCSLGEPCHLSNLCLLVEFHPGSKPYRSPNRRLSSKCRPIPSLVHFPPILMQYVPASTKSSPLNF